MRYLVENYVKKIIGIEFVRYAIAGATGTLVDWGSFYTLVTIIQVHYQASLIVSFSLGAITNYILNKYFTFKDKSRQIVGQFSIFFTISIVSLIASMGIMFLFVDLILMHKVLSRIITTFIMLLANYIMHKYITFNKRIFK
jgi:putative flippase GtrA